MGYGFHRNRKPNLSLLRISVYMLKNIETDKFKNTLRACIYVNICYMNYHIPQQNKCHHAKQLRTTYLHYLSFKLTSRFFYGFFFHCHAIKKKKNVCAQQRWCIDVISNDSKAVGKQFPIPRHPGCGFHRWRPKGFHHSPSKK